MVGMDPGERENEKTPWKKIIIPVDSDQGVCSMSYGGTQEYMGTSCRKAY